MMMDRLYITLAMLASLFLASCEVEMPEDIIKPGRMEQLLYDYHLAQSMSSEYTAADYKEKLFFDYVFSKHNVTKEQFENSMVWYNRYPKYLKSIYTDLEKRLEEEVERMGNAGVIEEDVSLDAVFLESDTVDLWTGSRNRILSCTMLDSHLSFGFDVPDDSTFVAGDSLSLSFSAMFVTAGIPDIRQLAHAALSIEYEDGSTGNKSVDMDGNGEYVVAVNRNTASKPKSVVGFVYYFDTDTTAVAKLLLSDISLKRIHPSKSVGKDN